MKFLKIILTLPILTIALLGFIAPLVPKAYSDQPIIVHAIGTGESVTQSAAYNSAMADLIVQQNRLIEEFQKRGYGIRWDGKIKVVFNAPIHFFDGHPIWWKVILEEDGVVYKLNKPVTSPK